MRYGCTRADLAIGRVAQNCSIAEPTRRNALLREPSERERPGDDEFSDAGKDGTAGTWGMTMIAFALSKVVRTSENSEVWDGVKGEREESVGVVPLDDEVVIEETEAWRRRSLRLRSMFKGSVSISLVSLISSALGSSTSLSGSRRPRV